MQIRFLVWFAVIETHVMSPYKAQLFTLLIISVFLKLFEWIIVILFFFPPGMNAAVRAVVRMGLYVGAKVYFIHEVSPYLVIIIIQTFLSILIVYFIL